MTGNVWQNGPENKSEWPLKGNLITDIPDLALSYNIEVSVPQCVIDPSKFSDYSKLINVTSRIFKAIRSKSFNPFTPGVLKAIPLL